MPAVLNLTCLREAKMPTKVTHTKLRTVVQTIAGEQGFTLLESLVGMLLITTIVVTITPPIFLTVAIRVQNRRAEQAMQLAQGEIDRVRVLVEQGNYTDNDLPAVPATSPSNIQDVSAPTTLSNTIKSDNSSCTNLYTGTQIAANTTLGVDIDRDCQRDFLVQTFRDSGLPVSDTNNQTIAFRMGIRVYAAVAEQNLANLDTQRASLQFTTSLGSQRSRPLAVLYTTVIRSDSNLSLCKYKDFLSPPPTGGSSACNP